MRYLQAGLELRPHEVVVSGPPWRTLVCVVWGRIREHVSYEDTQRTLEFDRRLSVLAR